MDHQPTSSVRIPSVVPLQPPQQEAKSCPDGLGLLKAGNVFDLLEDPPLNISESNSGFPPSAQLGQMSHTSSSCTQSADLYGEGVAETNSLQLNSVSSEYSAEHYPVRPVADLQVNFQLGWLFDLGKDRSSLAERVLGRLIQSEAHEVNPHFRDDYRQTFIALATLQRGQFATFWDAFVAASYQLYGLHPDKLWKAISARRIAMLGPAGEISMLGSSPQISPVPSSPKKPVQSVKAAQERKRA